MKHSNVIVAYLILSMTYAQFNQCCASNEPFLMLRNNGRLLFIHPPQKSVVNVSDRTPVYKWEGPSSWATFSEKSNSVSVTFTLDVYGGPDWIVVMLNDSPQGLTCCVKRTTCGSDRETYLFKTRHFLNYGAFMADVDVQKAQVDVMVSNLWMRYHQHRLVPEVSVLRHSLFHIPVPRNTFKDTLCKFLIWQMDNEEWKIRCMSETNVHVFDAEQRTIDVASTMILTPEQQSHIDCLKSWEHIYVPKEYISTVADIVLTSQEHAAR